MIFFLGYNKICKHKFSVLDIAEPQSKEMLSVSYVTYVFFRCANLELRIIIILLTDQPKIILQTAETTKN